MSEKKEACGLIGITHNPQAIELTTIGLFALQHRGEESCGIACSDGHTMNSHLGMGLVHKNFNPTIKKNLHINGQNPTLAIGHTRYAITGQSEPRNIQPIIVDHLKGVFALAHNGNLTNSRELKYKLEQGGAIFQTTNDSEIFVHLIAKSHGKTFKDCVIDAMHHVKGAYSLIIMEKDKLYAIRDPHGFRPLALGKIPLANGETSLVVASETCALDFMGAEYLGAIKPGELVVLSNNGTFTREKISASQRPDSNLNEARCIFEMIYFARPDSLVFDESVYAFRKKLGRILAQEAPATADIVIPIPDSGNCSALGYAETTGIPLEFAITRNHYTSRSFIQPDKDARQKIVNLKLNPIKNLIAGKRIVVIDDSIVRGTTTKEKIRNLRKCGAKEIHMRVASPPIISGCYYGIDFPDKRSLIANNKSNEQIRKHLEVDSLAYISIAGMLQATQRRSGFCTACFTGSYPTPIDTNQTKEVLTTRA